MEIVSDVLQWFIPFMLERAENWEVWLYYQTLSIEGQRSVISVCKLGNTPLWKLDH